MTDTQKPDRPAPKETIVMNWLLIVAACGALALAAWLVGGI